MQDIHPYARDRLAIFHNSKADTSTLIFDTQGSYCGTTPFPNATTLWQFSAAGYHGDPECSPTNH
jgi:hypothetical protein